MAKDEAPKRPVLTLRGQYYMDPDGRTKYPFYRNPDGTLTMMDSTEPATDQEIAEAQRKTGHSKVPHQLPNFSAEEREGWLAIAPDLLEVVEED